MASVRGCLLLILLAFCPGCGSSQPQAPEPFPLEFFNQTQGGTSTPHGTIVPGSGRNAENGRIRYETADGSRFEVTPHRTAEGYYYTDAVKVTPDSQ